MWPLSVLLTFLNPFLLFRDPANGTSLAPPDDPYWAYASKEFRISNASTSYDLVGYNSSQYNDGIWGISPWQNFWSNAGMRAPFVNLQKTPPDLWAEEAAVLRLSNATTPLPPTTGNTTTTSRRAGPTPQKPMDANGHLIAGHGRPNPKDIEDPRAVAPPNETATSSIQFPRQEGEKHYIMMTYYGGRVAFHAPIMMDVAGSLVWTADSAERMPNQKGWSWPNSRPGITKGWWEGAIDERPGTVEPEIWSDQKNHVLPGEIFNLQVYDLNGEQVLCYYSGGVVAPPGFGHGAHFVFDKHYQFVTKIGALNTTLNPRAEGENMLDFHEAIITDRGTALVATWREQIRDLSVVHGPENGWVLECVVQEINITAPPPLPILPPNLVQYVNDGWLYDQAKLGKLQKETGDGPVVFTANETIAIDAHRARKEQVDAGMMNDRGHVLLKEWRSLDWIAVEETRTMIWKSGRLFHDAFDYSHMNSIEWDLGHQYYLMSMRNTASVVCADRETGEVVWRLGGKKTSFVMGPGANFEFQHHVRWVDRNLTRMREKWGGLRLSLFDNAASLQESDEPTARALIIHLDTDRWTASLVQDFMPTDGTFSRTQGSVQVLENGNVFVGWGERPWMSEYDSSGRLLYDVRFGTSTGTWQQFQLVQTYRATRAPWVGLPLTRPSVMFNLTRPAGYYVNIPPGVLPPNPADWGALEKSNASVMANLSQAHGYVSWNGATEVEAWQVVAARWPDLPKRMQLPDPAAANASLTPTPTRWLDSPTASARPTGPPEVRMHAAGEPVLRRGFETRFEFGWDIVESSDFLGVLAWTRNGTCLGGSDAFFAVNGSYAYFAVACPPPAPAGNKGKAKGGWR